MISGTRSRLCEVRIGHISWHRKECAEYGSAGTVGGSIVIKQTVVRAIDRVC